jgi:glyoxylase-like metal-dependent hydrolase (beta-lactamase superfamily II)
MGISARQVAPGLLLILTESQICGTWLLVNGKACIIVETPPGLSAQNIDTPAELVLKYLQETQIRPIGLTLTHHHWDHSDGIKTYQEKLKQYMPFPWICHQSLIEIKPSLRVFFDVVFKEEIYELTIEGEPLFLIHGPKHSETDVLIVFRGAMITGDWWLGEGDPNPNKIPPTTSVKSINRILEFLTMKSYLVHSLFSVHGNDFRYQQDVEGILRQTREYHERKI